MTISVKPLITSAKLDAQKFEKLAFPISNMTRKTSVPPQTQLMSATAPALEKFNIRKQTSSKMSSEKNEALKEYLSHLEQMLKQNPSNISLRVQLSNVKDLLK